MNFTTDRCINLPLALLRALRASSVAMLTTILICLVSFSTIATAQDSGDKPVDEMKICLLYTSPSPRDATLSRMPSSA